MNNEIYIYDAIKVYEEQIRNAAEKARQEEGLQVNVNPDCYVARELMYQTAILKKIENMLRNQKK